MDNSLAIALGITVIGMTLLFLALFLFYGLLSLMMKLFEDRPPKPEAQANDEQAAMESAGLLQAAAIAVALARAETGPGVAPAPNLMDDRGSSGESTSPWWSLHHQREVTRNPNVRRVP